jgi:Zn-dependent metalloprotease
MEVHRAITGGELRRARTRRLRLVAFTGALVAALSASAPGTAATSNPALQDLADASRSEVVVRSGDPAGREFATMAIPISTFTDAASASAVGDAFWAEYGAAFGVRDAESELHLRSVSTDALGGRHLRYDQRYRGLEVFGRQLFLHLGAKNVRSVNGAFASELRLPTTPQVSATGAAWTASRSVPARTILTTLDPVLLVYVDSLGGAHLAWSSYVSTARPVALWRVFVDALSGEVLRFHDDLHTVKSRETYTNNNTPACNTQDEPACVLPGTLLGTEAAPPGPGNQDAVFTHANTGFAYDYYQAFGFDSYDDAGHTMRSTVDFGVNYNNAFWCGDPCAAAYGSLLDGEQMVYGDGNGVVFSPLGRDPDVVVHELTHAVTEKTAGLDYFGQTGALNESYSDVHAVLANPPNWLVGEQSYTPGTPGDALRDMIDPHNGNQPADMSEFVNTAGDNGGVHINSGIPNRAAYLVSEGPGYGVGREVTKQLYFYSLTSCLSDIADFGEHLLCLLEAADFAPGVPDRAAARRAVARAHATVGIGLPPEVTLPAGGTLTAGVAANAAWDAPDMGVPFRVELVSDGPPITLVEGFEASPFLPSYFTVGGTLPWIVDSAPPLGATGARAGRAGAITHDQTSTLTVLLRNAATSTFSFRRRVDSEPNFDFYSLHVNGFPVAMRSGFADWSTQTLPPLPPGVYVFTFVYEKDSTDSVGADTVWIDDITLTNARTGTSTSITPATVPGAAAQVFTPATAGTYTVRVTSAGIAPWLAESESAAFAVASPSSPPPQPQPQPPPQPQPQPPPPVRPPAQVTPRCKVPNVKRNTLAKAKAALRKNRCAPGRIKQAFSAKVKKGRVISQSRRPGASLPRNTKVNLTVSKGARKK